MFKHSEIPRLFALPPGADFGRAFVDGLLERLDQSDPTSLARVEIIANTRRMERRMTALFSDAGATLLPKITPIAGLTARFPDKDVPPERPTLNRKLDLMQLTREFLRLRPGLAPESSSAELADSLASLFDELQSESVNADAIEALEIIDASGHWENNLAFIKIVDRYLSERRDGCADAEERQSIAVQALADRWSLSPPETPVIVAGSTGSRTTTLKLMDVVSRLPQGALVLPGFDFEMPAQAWADLTSLSNKEDHPQARYATLTSRMGILPADVIPWQSASGPKSRNKLLSLALRPAPITHAWMREGPMLGDLDAATEDMELIEAPSQRIEAQAIALRLRSAVENGQTAALVSPDRILTRQVAAALSRWAIEPDDSAGRPLALSAPGRLLLHLANAIGQTISSQDLIVLLKHPLTHSGSDGRGEHLRLTRELELWFRRKGCVFPTRAALLLFSEKHGPKSSPWATWVADFCEALGDVSTAPLDQLIERHVELAENLAAGPSGAGAGELWQEKPGEEAKKAIDDLSQAARGRGAFSISDYRALLASGLNAREVRDPVRPHPGVMIWGTLEARVQAADLVILGGLNEGVWPDQPDPDPWLSRAMRRDIGLLPIERRIGLAAHDFQQAAAAPTVVLSRSLRSNDAASVPSRWLNRLVNLLSGLTEQGGKAALEAMRARGYFWIDLAELIDLPVERTAPEPRPAPRPPPAVRPRRLPVTDIEKLIRDPYAIYARRVLGLRKLDSLDRQPDHALRGTVMHRVFERFLRSGVPGNFDEAKRKLLGISGATLDELVVWPEARRLWQARMTAIADGFLKAEMDRQEEGTPFPPERSGELVLDDPPFTLVAKADRIDQISDDIIAIYDYKTGEVPSEKVVNLFAKQLLLEAIIAERGGFADVPASTVEKVGYIAASTTHTDRIIPLTKTDKFDFTTESILRQFQSLIAAFDERSRGYTSRRAVRESRFDGDYDHLARYGEWDISDDPTGIDVG